ncbi:MAG TPA: winged helix-turn-helix domain-containing protein [Burkholderiaceae bacterium]|jgi:predicted ATPase
MSPLVADPIDHVYVFDGFTLDPSRRSLVREDQGIALGSRALELLIALLEQAGEVLSRDHLTSRVWPRTVVEESSLRVHMAALRRALGDGQEGRRYIATIPGRGYGFVAEVRRRSRNVTVHQAAEALPGIQPADAQPQRHARLIGRDRALSALTRLLEANRLVTVVGPGGVGKSSVALHWAEIREQPPCIVDLAKATGEAEVLQSLATALDVAASTGWASMVSVLRESPRLLVMDGCEHVIDVAARLAHALLAEVPELQLLATSREPLNVDGEHVYRLEALDLPAKSPRSLDEALEAPALSLLIERARASGNDVDFDDADAAALCELARQLDGLPLALELGAARIRALGLKGMLSRLEDLHGLLNRGRRTALPRHRSLEAAIGWSYELLDETERSVLRALSAFPGTFSLSNAAAVVGAIAACGSIEEQVLRLVEKSLVLAVPTALQAGSVGDCTCYRLANTTRRYAALQLQSNGDEAARVLARHALELGVSLAPSTRAAVLAEEATQ